MRSRNSTKSARILGKEEDSQSSDSEPNHSGSLIKDHLTKAQDSLHQLLSELESLRKNNEKLAADLARLQDTEEVERSAPSNSSLQKQVAELRGIVRDLENAKEKDRRKIKAYKLRELKREAEDLVRSAHSDTDEGAPEDQLYIMRKLLRRFHDLMIINVLDEGEECVICYEVMQVDKCFGLPCEHVVCQECLPNICKIDWDQTKRTEADGYDRGVEITTCPVCRDVHDREDVKTILYTPTKQWDELQEIATEWANVDSERAVDDTSEEEDQQHFLNDESTDTASVAPSEHTALTDDENDQPALNGDPTRPDKNNEEREETRPVSYHKSPAKLKRERLDELVAQKSKRRRS